jgi:hypothetical protein
MAGSLRGSSKSDTVGDPVLEWEVEYPESCVGDETELVGEDDDDVYDGERCDICT